MVVEETQKIVQNCQFKYIVMYFRSYHTGYGMGFQILHQVHRGTQKRSGTRRKFKIKWPETRFFDVFRLYLKLMVEYLNDKARDTATSSLVTAILKY
jgi:hypothetical protein